MVVSISVRMTFTPGNGYVFYEDGPDCSALLECSSHSPCHDSRLGGTADRHEPGVRICQWLRGIRKEEEGVAEIAQSDNVLHPRCSSGLAVAASA